MAFPTFIRLENTLEAAMYYRNGAQMKHFHFAGVQLLPNQEFPYVQSTNASDSINVSDFSVFVCDLCGNELADITSSFDVISSYVDDAGNTQIEWSLENIDFDAGYRLIYLKIQVGIDSYIHSSPFYLTAFNSEYTSVWHYRNSNVDTMMCIGLNVYFKQEADEQELSNYTPVAYRLPFTASTRLTNYEIWRTDIIDIAIFRKLKQIFTNKYRYVDFAFSSLKEAFETPVTEGAENYGEADILLYRDESNIYDPDAIIPTPPVPPVEKQIILNSVTSLNNNQVSYNHTEIGFEPTYLVYEYSLDQVTWIQTTLGPESPKTVDVDGNTVNSFYYRIYHTGYDIESNVLQIPVRSIVITNMSSQQTVWKPGFVIRYKVFFNVNNFTMDIGTVLSIEYSVDGTTYGNFDVNLTTALTGTGKEAVFTPTASGQQYTKFRIRYATYALLSNVYEFELPTT